MTGHFKYTSLPYLLYRNVGPFSYGYSSDGSSEMTPDVTDRRRRLGILLLLERVSFNIRVDY